MDALSVFSHYIIAQSWNASYRIAIDAEFATYCICNSSSSKPNFIDDAEVSRIDCSLRSSVRIWSVSFVSRADVFRHAWKWFMKR